MHPHISFKGTLLISGLFGVIDFVWRCVHQRSILASVVWVILGPAVLLTMLSTSVSYAQVPRALVYIQSPRGLEGALAASIAKKNPHIQVVTDRAEATYVLSVSPLELTTSMTFVSKHVRASVMLIERVSKQAVWVYDVWVETEGRRNEQAVADKIARRLNMFIQKNGGLLVGDGRLPQPHGLRTMFSANTEEVFLIPNHYKGHAYVVYGAAGGRPLIENREQVIYRIPQDGVLRIRDSTLPTTQWTVYYYEREDGSLRRIPVLSRTATRSPDDIDGDIEASTARDGMSKGPAGCVVQFKKLYIDTDAQLLSEYQQEDLGHFAPDLTLLCSK